MQRVWIYNGRDSIAVSGKYMKLRAHILSYKHKAERLSSKSYPQRTGFLIHSCTFLNLHQTMPPTGDQMFIYGSFWRTFLFKHTFTRWLPWAAGNIMWNDAFSPTPKIPIVFPSFNTLKVQSLLRLKILLNCKHKLSKTSQVTYFQYIIIQNICYHSKWEELGRSEKTGQSKIETEQTKH